MPHIQKIIKNIPKQELGKFLEDMNKLISEDPEKFMYMLLNEPKFLLLHCPKRIKELIALYGATTVLVPLLGGFVVASYLSKLEREAGRYGVMQGIKSLDNYKLFADVEPSLHSANIQTSLASKSLIDNYLNKNKLKQKEFSSKSLIDNYLNKHSALS